MTAEAAIDPGDPALVVFDLEGVLIVRSSDGVRPPDGLRAVLETLHVAPPVLLGAATNAGRGALDGVLARHDLARFFFATRTRSEAAAKPAPDMILQLIAATGATPRRSVMIGDSAGDMRAARAAGAAAIGAVWSPDAASESALRAAGAAAIIRRPDEAFSAIVAALGPIDGLA